MNTLGVPRELYDYRPETYFRSRSQRGHSCIQVAPDLCHVTVLILPIKHSNYNSNLRRVRVRVLKELGFKVVLGSSSSTAHMDYGLMGLI